MDEEIRLTIFNHIKPTFMNPKKLHNPLGFIPWYLLCLILFAVLFSPASCNIKISQPKPLINYSFSWNILFKPGTNEKSKDSTINSLRNYLKNYYSKYQDPNSPDSGISKVYTIIDTTLKCPCDLSLYNYNFSAIDGMGKAATTTADPKQPAANGGLIDVLVLADNTSIKDSVSTTDTSNLKKYYVKENIKPLKIDKSKKLAIIDTGIDPALFNELINRLIWKDVIASNTLYNFLPFQSTADYKDRSPEYHGSAVAAIAIKSMEGEAGYSKLMILKALDSDYVGSIFSVSCALSYAHQKKADVINLSLGYFGDRDSILHRYIGLFSQSKIPVPVFAAAGNARGKHAAPYCQHNNENLLPNPTLFYPACFSIDFKHLISVTQVSSNSQVSNEKASCNFQNYSPEFITLGVFDKENCCVTPVGFLNNDIKYYEGSSFVTPIASGIKMRTILEASTMVMDFDPAKRITTGGRFISFSPSWR